jgi:hypothetical protein
VRVQDFCRLYGFSTEKLYQCKRGNSPGRHKQHGNRRSCVPSAHHINWQDELQLWIENQIEELGDKNPSDNTVHMPVSFKPADYYIEFCADMINQHHLPPSASKLLPAESTFIAVVRELFTNVRFPKKTRLAICDTCVKLQTHKMLAATKREKTTLRQRLRAHLALAATERVEYKRRCKAAERNPADVWSIIIDMLEKFHLPSLPRLPKKWIKIYRIPIEINGIINHSLQILHITAMLPNYKHDPNLVISLIYQHIYGCFRKTNIQRAPILYIQVYLLLKLYYFI